MKRVVEVVPYDPGWIGLFEGEAELLRSVFGREVVAIHHIGSTSIPGMTAKPIIDVLLEVRDIERVDAYNEPMGRLGSCRPLRLRRTALATAMTASSCPITR